MKKFRLPDNIAVTAGLLLLLTAGLFAAFWPQDDFSDHERRYLSSRPDLPSLSNWQIDREIESYLSDRVPFRRVLVALDSAANVLTGRRTQLETWPAAGSYLEKPVVGELSVLKKRFEQMDALAAKAGADWHVLTPPSHGSLLREQMNPLMRTLYDAEAELYMHLEADGHAIPLSDVFSSADEPYYATDHHWTLEGAYAAYQAYCRTIGITPAPLSTYEQTSYAPFYGTTYSRSGMPFAAPDTLHCAQPANPLSLIIHDDGSVYDTLIFPEQASTYDGYAVYMNGNHGMAEILNPAAPNRTLLVFKDSFANCALPLLSAHFSRVVAVDARYCSMNFSEAAAAAGQADQILFLYSLDSLLNDTVVARKIAK